MKYIIKSKDYGCETPTSWAFVGCGSEYYYEDYFFNRYSLTTLDTEDYIDLELTDWDYAKEARCGSLVDNIDSVKTYYLCPKCKAKLKSHPSYKTYESD